MKKLLILSGKGGTGKTTTAAAFIDFSGCTLVADCDVDAPNLHLMMSKEGRASEKDFYGGEKAYIDEEKCIGCGKCYEKCRFNAIKRDGRIFKVDEFACEGCGVCEYICKVKAVSLREDIAGKQKIYMKDRVFSTATLKMGRGNSGKLVTSVKRDAIDNGKDRDLLIIDGSPGIGCPVIASINGVDLVLIVAEASLSGMSDLERIINTAKSFGVKVCVCINKADEKNKNLIEIKKYLKKESIPFVGEIPYDKNIVEANNMGKSVAKIDSKARDALLEIYKKTSQLL